MLNAVLVIGGGAREHALIHGLRQSAQVGNIFCAPGNAGIAAIATIAPIDIKNGDAVARFVKEENIALTVIGPEAPLVDGLSDALRAQGHRVVGASRAAAQLEGSKVYAKHFMEKYGIPTAAFRMFDDAAAAKEFARSEEGRKFRVLKADGLAAGKGVVVAKTSDQLIDAISEALEDNKFGAAGSRILLEETLSGPEVSVIALTDGRTVLPLPASQDHKRAFDNDRGPNTGGMGAYAPTPFYDDGTRILVEKHVINNFVRGLAAERLDFRGIIYFGLMLTKAGPKVLEFNVRFGDPEAEVVLPLVKSDLFDLFVAVAEGKLAEKTLEKRSGAACTVVMASEGYPGPVKSGVPITGLDLAGRSDSVVIFHAGTQQQGENVVTAGGRVLAVTGLGRSLETAVVRAYQGVKRISFKGAHYRTDIAAKAMKNKFLATRIRGMKKRKLAAAR